MYKVFFNDRTVFLKEDFLEAFKTQSGLFYKYESRENLSEIITAFFHLDKINELHLFHTDQDFLQSQFTSLFEPIKAAGGLIRNSNNEFIMIRRKGFWDLPKGKADEGETSEQTAIREVCEECGILPPAVEGFLVKTYHTYMLHGKAVLKDTDWFEMRVKGEVQTTPQSIENITEVRWFRPDEVEAIKDQTYPLILDVLKHANII